MLTKEYREILRNGYFRCNICKKVRPFSERYFLHGRLVCVECFKVDRREQAAYKKLLWSERHEDRGNRFEIWADHLRELTQ